MKRSKTFVETFFLWSLVLVLITLTMPKYSLNSQAIIVCFVTWFFVGSFKQKWELFKTRKWLFLITSSLFWISLLGLLYTENMEEGLKNFQKALPFLIFPLVFSTIQFSEEKRNIVFQYFSIGVLISSAFALAKAFYFKFNNLGDYFYYDSFALLLDKHTTYFALFTVIAVVFFLNEILKGKARNSFFHICAILYLLVILYLLSARISIIALMVGAVLLLLFNLEKLGIKKLVPIVIIILMLGIAYATPNFQERFYATTPEGVPISDLDTRAVHWKSALQLINNNNLIIGAGTGDGHTGLYEQYLENGFETGYINQYNAHNQFLESTLYYGVLGLLALVSIFLLGLIRSLKNRDVLAFSTITIIAVFMCTESLLERHSGIVFVSFIIALILPLKTKKTEKMELDENKLNDVL